MIPLRLSESGSTWGGVSTSQLIRDFGSPLYVYDEACFTARLTQFRQAFRRVQPKILYAAKANSNLEVLKCFQCKGTGLDTVSINEVRLGLKAGFSKQDILFTPNGVPFEELQEAIELGVRINIENLSYLRKLVKDQQFNSAISLRLNPHLQLSEEDSATQWYEDSKFGIPLSQFDGVREILKGSEIEVEGLHIHSSSVIQGPKVFKEMVGVLLGLASSFPDLKFIDFGGGLGVPYRENEEEVDIEGIGDSLFEQVQKFFPDENQRPEFWFEPGRFLTSDAGILIAKVTVIKESSNTCFAFLDTGFNHLVRPQMYGAYHRIVNLSSPMKPLERYTVVGNICETDAFAKDYEMPELQEGDLVGILNAGAYGYSMASQYNLRGRPAEVLIQEGEPRLIRARETFEDIVVGSLRES